MAMPTTILTCPDCGATLRPHKPPSPGNKVRCPGCKVIFTVGGEPEPSGALLEPPEPVLESAPLNPLAGLADALAADPVQPVPPEERRVWERKRRDPVDDEAQKKKAAHRSPALLIAAVICAVIGLILVVVGIVMLASAE